METKNNNWSVGETVLVQSYHYGTFYKRHTITKITPSGIIVLDNGERFNAEGGWIGKIGIYDIRPQIIKYDQSLYDAQIREQRIKWVRQTGVQYLTDDECAELYTKLAQRHREKSSDVKSKE